ncbi:hypothetical protein Misp02_05850 [Microtetraspora sp. NBRC 16547]|nr:hypothetical protein Misp02_05850 [Microtetraspora sp. NBRC 16547]
MKQELPGLLLSAPAGHSADPSTARATARRLIHEWPCEQDTPLQEPMRAISHHAEEESAILSTLAKALPRECLAEMGGAFSERKAQVFEARPGSPLDRRTNRTLSGLSVWLPLHITRLRAASPRMAHAAQPRKRHAR